MRKITLVGLVMVMLSLLYVHSVSGFYRPIIINNTFDDSNWGLNNANVGQYEDVCVRFKIPSSEVAYTASWACGGKTSTPDPLHFYIVGQSSTLQQPDFTDVLYSNTSGLGYTCPSWYNISLEGGTTLQADTFYYFCARAPNYQPGEFYTWNTSNNNHYWDYDPSMYRTSPTLVWNNMSTNRSLNFKLYSGGFFAIHTFENNVPEMIRFTSNLSVTFESGVIPWYSVSFCYKGNCRAVTGEKNGGVLNLNASDIAPVLDATQKMEIYWEFNYTGGSSTVNDSHTVQRVFIDDCPASSDSLLVLNTSFYIEDFTSVLIHNATDLEIVFDYWISDSDISKNASFSKTGNYSYMFCLSPSNTTVSADAYLKYNIIRTNVSGDLPKHRYFIVNKTLSNLSIYQVSAFNFNYTSGLSGIKGTARDFSNYQYYPNVYASLQRYYPGVNVWHTVQMDKSGDFGLLSFDIIEKSVDYRFRFYDEEGSLIKTTNTMKFICSSGLCDLTFLLNPLSTTTTSSALVINDTFDNVSRMWYVQWDDPLGGTSNINMKVTKDTASSTITICDQSSAAASGTLSCNVSGYTGSMRLQVYSSASPEVYAYAKWITVPSQKIYDFVSKQEGAFWGVGIVSTTFLFGIFSPVAGVISLILGVVIVYFMGLMSTLSITFVVVLCCMGLLIALKIKK